MKQVILLIVGYFLIANLYAQDKEAEARFYYQKAEDAYINAAKISSGVNKQIDWYNSCLNYLDKSEKTLGQSNSKILYLKIKSMFGFSPLYYSYDIDTALKPFFKVTDVSKYPTEKYAEMIEIKGYFTSNEKNISFFKEYKAPDYKNSSEGNLCRAEIYLRNDLY